MRELTALHRSAKFEFFYAEKIMKSLSLFIPALGHAAFNLLSSWPSDKSADWWLSSGTHLCLKVGSCPNDEICF